MGAGASGESDGESAEAAPAAPSSERAACGVDGACCCGCARNAGVALEAARGRISGAQRAAEAHTKPGAGEAGSEERRWSSSHA